jgi:8-oxo-dGTP diphosphatase
MGKRNGDGFVRCSDGHVRWGVFGAAGVLFMTSTPDGPVVMVQKRSMYAHEGGTWSVAGGAIDEGETPLEAAMREASEEVGTPADPYHVVGEYVFAPAHDWSYTTAVVHVPEPFGGSLNFETDAIAWLAPHEVDALPQHPGFAAAWPHLRAIVASSIHG